MDGRRIGQGEKVTGVTLAGEAYVEYEWDLCVG